jgi:hypothetical protein
MPEFDCISAKDGQHWKHQNKSIAYSGHTMESSTFFD